MIPKVIHYCWFGGNPKPSIAERCMKSWEKQCPDYKIIEWNELNYNIDSAPLYVRQAYDKKKWAFVADFARLQIIYEYGGIYLDTDVELVNTPEELLKYHAYFGFEGTDYINTGLGFGAEQGNHILLELMKDYEDIPFVLKGGNYDTTPCPQRNTKIFLRYGLICNGMRQQLNDGTMILPPEYLCPLDNATRILRKTSNTISIHHFDASWQSKEQRKEHDKIARQRRCRMRLESISYFPRWMMRKIIGDARYEKIKRSLKSKIRSN